MNLRKCFCSLLFSLCSLLIAFSGVSAVDAAAVDYVPDIPAGGKYLTSSEALEVFSRDITYKVWTGSDYVTRTSSYSGTRTGAKVYGYMSDQNNTVTEITTDFTNPDTLFLTFPLNLSDLRNNDNYPAIIIDIPFTLTNTDYFYTSCGMLADTITATSHKPVWSWNVSGSSVDFTSRFSSLNAYADYMKLGTTSPQTFIPVSYTSQTFSDYSSIQVVFPRGSSSSSRNFYVACPYVSSTGDVSAETQTTAPVTTAAPSTGTNVNVNVDVDMTETNGILGRIEVILDGILEGIKNLFVPDDEFLEGWVDDMKELLEDHLGGLYQAIDMLDEFWQQFENVRASDSIYIPPVSVPLAGVDFVLGNWTVPLKVNGLPAIFYDALALIVDFLAVMSFLKMCRNKLEIILNPDSEVVQSDS